MQTVSEQLEVVAAEVNEASETWKHICSHWQELNLPGSPYLPNDFLIRLLLAQFGKEPSEIARAVHEGERIYKSLSHDFHLTMLLSSSNLPIVALALYAQKAGIAAVEPAAVTDIAVEPEPESVVASTTCNCCGHNSETCAAGGYATPAVSEPEPVAPVVACPNCAHDFAACAAGEYATSAAGTEPQPEIAGCDHTGADGKCLACTDEEVVTCDDCNEEIAASKSHKCKDYENCGYEYCSDCAKGNLNARGYCNDCAVVSCDVDGCDEEMDRDDEIRCANPDCPDRYDHCQDCAKRLLNKDGLCYRCAGEKESDCSDCNMPTLESNLTWCKDKDCDNAYCPNCVKSNLSRKGLCSDCE